MLRRAVLTGIAAVGVTGCGRPEAPDPVGDALDLSDLEARHGGRLGLAMSGPRGRRLWRSDERFNYCSTFKLFLAAAMVERVSRGQERMDRAVAISLDDITPHAPVTGEAVGESLTIEQLCEAVVTQSDNPAANILIRELGGLDAWRLWYRAIGDTVTRVDRWEPELNLVGGQLDTTTPAQTAANLDWLRPAVFRPDTSAPWLIRWLGNPAGPGRLRAALPADWALLHKTGTASEGPTNDIGYLVPRGGGQAEAIAVAVYYEAPAGQTLGQREAVIAEATRAALTALGHA